MATTLTKYCTKICMKRFVMMKSAMELLSKAKDVLSTGQVGAKIIQTMVNNKRSLTVAVVQDMIADMAKLEDNDSDQHMII